MFIPMNFPVIFLILKLHQLLFEKSNMGYSTLVKNMCDVDIKEGSWRTNWLKRPLSDEKSYAADI